MNDTPTRPRFGPGGNCEAFHQKYGARTVLAPAWVVENGLDAYEYEAGRGLAASPDTLSALGREAARLGVALSFHAPYFISLSGVEADKRQRSVAYISESLEAAALLGARIIVVHCGSAGRIDRAEAMRLAADTLSLCLTQLPDNGVLIGVETMGKINQLGTLEEVIRLCRLDPSRLTPVVDFGHLNARTLGTAFPDRDAYARVFEQVAQLGDEHARRLHCHFSRIEYTAGGEKRHVTFADTQWGPEPEPLMRAVRDLGVSPTFICESAGTQTADAAALSRAYAEASD